MQLLKCELGTIPMRKEPTDRSEMISQMIFGETAELLDQNEKWMMVRTQFDHYEGWVDKKQLVACQDEQQSTMITSLFAQITDGHESKVIPAGSYIDLSHSKFEMKSGEIGTSLEYHNDSLEKTARMFLGSPYLWGGRTFAGIDCSGFTQIVFKLHGKKIRRDAWQQSEQGEAVTFIEEAQSGDLAFFDNADGKIIHVGIIFRTKNNDIEIIHASGKVRCDALDHQGIFKRETGEYTHQLRIIKRI